MAGIIRNTPRTPKEQVKGGHFVRLIGDQKEQFQALMKDLGFDPESPRADAGVRKVGEMVAAFGMEAARAVLASGSETFAEYIEKVKAEAKAVTEDTPKA